MFLLVSKPNIKKTFFRNVDNFDQKLFYLELAIPNYLLYLYI